MKKTIMVLCLAFAACAALADVAVKSVEAHPRYPWNGKVDIVVSLAGSAADVAAAECFFAATNAATLAALPVAHIAQQGSDTGSGTTWTRRFVWDAAADVGAVKIDDVALTVEAKVRPDGVQLWADGPYWAECNVGASKPEEYGYYFWWGDTVGYVREGGTWTDNYYYSGVTWVSSTGTRMASSPFTSSNCPTFGKDNSALQSAGYIDATGNLVAAYDAATAHLGAPWRMPTDAEFSALISNCDTMWTARGGVYGLLVTGRGVYASKSIFLPAAGYGRGSDLKYTGSVGHCWSSTPNSDYSGRTWSILFGSDYFYRDYLSRSFGMSVRPLRGFASDTPTTVLAGVTTHLTLDGRTGTRFCSAEGEPLRYDAGWYAGGDAVRITDNGVVLTNGTAGVYAWRPAADGATQHLLTLEVLSGGQVVGTETARFTLGYIRNVTARQLWPHNKVALSFTVAEDIGGVKRADENLCVWCARGAETNEAARIIGDRSAKPGVHRIIWDMEADGLRFANDATTFGVSAESVVESLGGVQLWENGPYWAECNVGASKPEEYGYYFWWGDTVGYKRNAANNGWVSAKDGSSFSFSSDNCPTYGMNDSELQSAGYIDGNLVAVHDAATAHLGAPWRMPTDAEIDALISNCTTTWITTNGVNGRLVTGKGAYASKSIFLPAAGGGFGLYYTGSYGGCWSSSPHSGGSYYAWGLYFYSGGFYRSDYTRYDGRSVRPLRGFAK